MRAILVVDDEPAVRNFLQAALSRAGYRVSVAADAEEAKAAGAAESFDILLTDVVMPGADGYQLASWFYSRLPATRAILMSGYDRLEGSLESRSFEFLPKPFTLKQVISAIDQALAPAS